MCNIRSIIVEITLRILILHEYPVSKNPGKFCRWFSIWKIKTSLQKTFIRFNFSYLCYIICIDWSVIWQIKENVNCLFLILQYPTKSLFFYCRSWIKTNSKISRKKSQESRDYSKDVKEITGQLKKMVGVRAIGWHTNWGPRRFTACLTSLEKVSENHPILVKKFLSGK